jgi:mannose-6-phosphate isomerase
MTPYPLLFVPILKEKVWGGRTLESFGKSLDPDPAVRIGESWEVADLPDDIEGGRSIVANGEIAGLTLREAIEAHRDAIMGSAGLTEEGGFPLLVKYLDARENLSVQVHPDAAYAARHPEARLKSEAWLVVAAQPGAVIYRGVEPGVTRELLARHIETGEVVGDLARIPARVGDCHYLPSGTCHALGAGVVVAEIQTPSDTTFRLYDWDRAGRRLRVQAALSCIRLGAEDSSPPVEPPVEVGNLVSRRLIGTPDFDLERVDAREDGEAFSVVTDDRPEVWMILDGRARIRTEDAESVDVRRGATVLIPARIHGAAAALAGGASVLRITLPSPIRGLMA